MGYSQPRRRHAPCLDVEPLLANRSSCVNGTPPRVSYVVLFCSVSRPYKIPPAWPGDASIMSQAASRTLSVLSRFPSAGIPSLVSSAASFGWAPAPPIYQTSICGVLVSCPEPEKQPIWRQLTTATACQSLSWFPPLRPPFASPGAVFLGPPITIEPTFSILEAVVDAPLSRRAFRTLDHRPGDAGEQSALIVAGASVTLSRPVAPLPSAFPSVSPFPCLASLASRTQGLSNR